MYESSILDTFTKADGALPAGWATPANISYLGANAAVVRGNRFAGATASTRGSAYWTTALAGAQQHRVTYQGTVNLTLDWFGIWMTSIPTGAGNPGNGYSFDITPSRSVNGVSVCDVVPYQYRASGQYALDGGGVFRSAGLVAGEIVALTWQPDLRKMTLEAWSGNVARILMVCSDKAFSAPSYQSLTEPLFPCLSCNPVADNILLDDWGVNALAGGTFVGESSSSWALKLTETKLPT